MAAPGSAGQPILVSRRGYPQSPEPVVRPQDATGQAWGMHRWDPIAPPIPDLVLPVRVDPTGRDGPTRAQARGPRWRRSSPGLYVPVGTPDDLVEQRIVEAYARSGDVGVV